MNTTPIISNLTDSELQCILRALDAVPLAQAAHHLANPSPIGIGRRLSTATLCRIRRQSQLQDHLAACEESRAAAALLPTQGDFLPASLAALSEKAFQLTLSERPADLQIAARILSQLAKTRASLGHETASLPKPQSERSGPPSTFSPGIPAASPVAAPATPVVPAPASAPAPSEVDDAFRQHVARLALFHHAELGSIRNNPGLNEARKLELVIARLFPIAPPAARK